MLLLGIDEAGYGPNLGPLVVASSAWEVPAAEGGPPPDLYHRLAPAVGPSAANCRLPIADSKKLYSAGAGLVALERTVLAAAGASGWADLVDRLAADPLGLMGRLPWACDFDPSLPRDADAPSIEAARHALRGACEAAGVAWPVLRARMVHPPEFNALVAEHGTKGTALSHTSIGLARETLGMFLQSSVASERHALCVFDKHGGRNQYGSLLARYFPEGLLQTLVETRPVSRYRWTGSLRVIDFEFRAQGEAFLPTALASMTAKYLREVAMEGFNAFWREHVPGLRPTAGYPVDAKRFRSEIAEAQRRLGIMDAQLWRDR